MKENCAVEEKRNEVYEIFQKLDANSQNILIVAGSCMLARQQMEEEKKEAS